MLREETVDGIVLELLHELMQLKGLKDFYLVGGTGLALQLGHRKSIDLDLFTNKTFDSKSLHDHLKDTFNDDYKNTALFKNGCMCFIKNVKVDLIRHNYPLLKSLIKENTIRLVSLEDIAAMKVNAIYGSGSRKKDFIDLYFLLNIFSLEQILGFYKKKYTHENLAFAIRSLIYFEDAEEEEWPEVIDNLLNWIVVKNKIMELVKAYLSF
ncbi:MAG: nucleotidyl transferase AbiEii/AbiGii toxin family protein [Bacteroidetes bacterium]|nr:nucleotidyl transferase AbiEii/AbiGii toxin family protein [Bacteroidota bacterium]MBL6964515.1 nucleotidyl transferase AbiEii/AbiGii toxin family protein [Bacteroidota bacterium]